MKRSYRRSLLEYGLALGIIALIGAAILPTVGSTCGGRGSGRTADASNLRQIGQACLIYAQGNKDRLPQASDVWEYAELLGEILNDPKMWVSKLDPASDNSPKLPTYILKPDTTSPGQLDPAFRKSKPCFAVVLGKALSANMPVTTPIAWTRGLQPDGTWSTHAPYGDKGGFIVFLGGNVAFYKDLKSAGDRLIRYDGQGETSNILEALPPGRSIGEYIPTAEEKAAWATIKR
jgi:hypothetical protein